MRTQTMTSIVVSPAASTASVRLAQRSLRHSSKFRARTFAAIAQEEPGLTAV